MTDLVADTLRLWRTTPFVWGDADCMLSIGDYVASAGAKDVTALFRGTYADEAGALAHMAFYGGMAGFAALAGLRPLAAPERGAVVALGGVFGHAGDGHVGALCTGRGVAARMHRGVIEIDLRFATIIGVWAA